MIRARTSAAADIMATMHGLPGPARALSTAISRAVSAAQAADRDAYESATADLDAGNPEQVGIVAGAVVRALLEDMHPDGLDSDDMHAVLERCIRDTLPWLPGVDVATLIVVLAGALGVHETDHQADEETRPPTRTEVARHAPLIIADLLGASGRRLGPYLDVAFAEIARAETQEMP